MARGTVCGAGFFVTIWWLLQEFDWQVRDGWLEPLAALLGGLGAFILAAILIARKVHPTVGVSKLSENQPAQ